MALLQVIPKVFYENIRDGIHLFIDCLGFTVSYKDEDTHFYVITRDNTTIILVEDAEFAKKDRPEIRIATDDIESLYNEVVQKDKNILHPNSNNIKMQPWGLKEFALRDASDVCIVIQQNV